MPRFRADLPPLAPSPVASLLVWIFIYMSFLSILLFLWCSKSLQMTKLKSVVTDDSTFPTHIVLFKSNLIVSKSVYSHPISSFHL